MLLYRLKKSLVVAALAIVGGYSQFISPLRGWQELFPLAPWALFAEAPHLREDFVIRVFAVDHRALSESCLLHECPGLLGRQNQKRVYWSTQSLGQFFMKKSLAEFAQAKAKILTTISPNRPLELSWKLEKRIINQIEYAKSKAVIRETELTSL